ncbi:DUF2844 domain-containing protein [Sphingomonas sp. QA11]|uniref:DUF2844 domain-containing protein n=1 Tax=Sphingomonas sp. QA11 TaxID=2950605 RepID=UPI00234967BB|nr:DUF2844 domain-containing protein [Sphingomonas sp. QA11]WCM27471.1 DUF2844 domain-containing protein [Sphingomonas sp. QA11]
MSHTHPCRIAFSLVTALVVASGAHAELGGTVSGVKSDSARMAAQMASVTIGNYSRHDLTRANGGAVHEFTNANGQVFAITWSGPGKPDLRALLGRYFTTFQAAGGATGRAMHSLRRPQQVNQADLQIQTGGHMGWFSGVAFIPSLAPAGFSPGDLPQEP